MTDALMILPTGEKVAADQLTRPMLKQVDDESLEELAYQAKMLKSLIKNVEDEMKTRLDEGKQFNRVSYTQRTKRIIPKDNNDLKQELVFKYGYDAVELKTPTALQRKYGDVIKEDLERITVLESTNAVKWE